MGQSLRFLDEMVISGTIYGSYGYDNTKVLRSGSKSDIISKIKEIVVEDEEIISNIYETTQSIKKIETNLKNPKDRLDKGEKIEE
jgi:hypothetical protein